jgi:LPS export ABC transporter protein LptC
MVGKAARSSKGEPLLILVMVIVLGIILTIFWSSHRSQGPTVEESAPEQEEATLSINGIRMTAVREGHTAWYLTADHGIYLDNNSKAIFNGITATFITDKGNPVVLTADRATYFSNSNDLEVSGHVVIKNDQYQLETEHLSYDHSHRVLTSNTRVLVKSEGGVVAADAMAYDLRTDQITLKGNIAGTLSEHTVL